MASLVSSVVDLPAAAPSTSSFHPTSTSSGDPSAAEPDDDVDESDGTPFQFSNQGQWVAVYWSDRFYIGQVIKVTDTASGKVADVQYLEQCSGTLEARTDSAGQ